MVDVVVVPSSAVVENLYKNYLSHFLSRIVQNHLSKICSMMVTMSILSDIRQLEDDENATVAVVFLKQEGFD